MRNVLITGSSGFLGGFIVERLSGKHNLTLADIREPDSVPEGCRFARCDVTDLAALEPLCAGQDVVVHTAALVRGRMEQPISKFVDVMVEGTWNVAEACARQGVKLLVNVSSVVAIGWPRTNARAYRVGDPAGYFEGDLYYCLAKRLGEEITRAYHEARGLRVINIRPGGIANDGANGEPTVPDPKPGAHWFMYVDARDVAQAIEKAVDNASVGFGTYQAVAGRDDTLFDWTEAADVLGYAPEHNWPELR